MHIFLTGLFEGVVLGIAIVLLIASLELRNGDRNDSALARSNFDEEQILRTRAREPLYSAVLSAQRPSDRANDSQIDRPVGQPFAAGLTLS